MSAIKSALRIISAFTPAHTSAEVLPETFATSATNSSCGISPAFTFISTSIIEVISTSFFLLHIQNASVARTPAQSKTIARMGRLFGTANCIPPVARDFAASGRFATHATYEA
jgi:hypothetical protein